MQFVKRTFLVGALLTLGVSTAQAVPTNYSFSGFSVGEFSGSGAQVIGSTIYDAVTQVNGTFTYDPDMALAGYLPVPGYNNAPFAAYSGAFSDMTMSLAGSTVSADKGLGLVGDNVTPTGTALSLDVLLGYSAPNVTGANFSGVTVGDWTLTSFSFVFFNSPNTFAGSGLPGTVDASSNLMEFFFNNAAGQTQKVRYVLDSVEQVVDVAEPTSGLLLGLGFAGLLLNRAKRKKEI